ncbi:MAG: peroxiredoxin [Candidatus Kapaibacterium sp.]
MALTVSVISAVEVGEKAPNVVLYDTNLQRVELRELFAQPTVLAFVPGAFTGVCTKEFCTFRDQMAEFNELDAQVIGISVDAPFSNAAWSKQNKFGFPVMSDFNREAVKAFDAYHENFAGMEGYTAPKRAVFIVDKEGIIRYKWISDHPGREPNYDEIKAELEKLED